MPYQAARLAGCFISSAREGPLGGSAAKDGTQLPATKRAMRTVRMVTPSVGRGGREPPRRHERRSYSKKMTLMPEEGPALRARRGRRERYRRLDALLVIPERTDRERAGEMPLGHRRGRGPQGGKGKPAK